MNYPEDTIDWQAIEYIGQWIDTFQPEHYRQDDLARRWSRIGKISEELGETVQAFIGMTGENPHKGYTHTKQEVLQELADTLITTIIAMQEFTQNSSETRRLIRSKIVQVEARLRAYPHKMD